MKHEQADLLLREIDISKLAKKHIALLSKCDRLVNHYRQYSPEVTGIHVYRDDYAELSKALKAAGQDITERTYHGYRLLPQ